MDELTLQVADEVGATFREGLAARAEARHLPVRLGAIGDGPADAIVVGIVSAPQDVRTGLQSGVRWIQSLATGVDSLLIPELLASQVVLTNSSGASAGPVAEFAMARILEHAKRLEQVRQQRRERSWVRFFQDGLEGATLTTVGLGPIGRRVAEIARSFGMHTIAVRRRPEAGPGPCHEVVGPGQLIDAMARSDHVVLAAAVTPETRQVLGAPELAAAKAGCFIVNVGRAELVDHDALVESAAAGRICAALDVFPVEPLPDNSPLWDTPGIVISPHIAVWTPRIVEVLAELTAVNLDNFAHGRPLVNVVDKRRGYVVS